MSNTQRAALADVPSIATSGRRRLAKGDRAAFRIDDDTYQLIKPKAAMLAGVVSMMESSEISDPANLQALLQLCSQFLAYIEAAPPDKDTGRLQGRALLEKRLSDPMDPLDLTELMPLFTTLLEGWLGRHPTGARPASGGPRKTSSGTGSRASTR